MIPSEKSPTPVLHLKQQVCFARVLPLGTPSVDPFLAFHGSLQVFCVVLLTLGRKQKTGLDKALSNLA